jgi:hypothetical protein
MFCSKYLFGMNSSTQCIPLSCVISKNLSYQNRSLSARRAMQKACVADRLLRRMLCLNDCPLGGAAWSPRCFWIVANIHFEISSDISRAIRALLIYFHDRRANKAGKAFACSNHILAWWLSFEYEARADNAKCSCRIARRALSMIKWLSDEIYLSDNAIDHDSAAV